MKKIGLIIILVISMIMPAMAKDLNIAYIDMQYILKNLPSYESANEQLTLISKRWQKEIDAAQQEARILATNYQTEQIFLSDDMKRKREEEIVAKENEVLESLEAITYSCPSKLSSDFSILSPLSNSVGSGGISPPIKPLLSQIN